jgi:hypothetical protein
MPSTSVATGWAPAAAPASAATPVLISENPITDQPRSATRFGKRRRSTASTATAVPM